MNEKTRKQVAYLMLGVFLGFALIQFLTSFPIEYPRTGYTLKTKKVKQYIYGNSTGIEEIVTTHEQYYELAASLDTIPRTGSRTENILRITLWNTEDSFRWINFESGYIDVMILNQSGVVCSIREGLEPFTEDYKVFLAPMGNHKVPLLWDGGFPREGVRTYLDDGLYDVVGIIRLGDQIIELSPISLWVETIDITYRVYETVPV